MAISTAAAILGSAVIGAGASAISSSKAAKKAADASNYAADQNAQVNREIYQQTRADLSPYNQAGQAGLAALMQRLGLSPTGTTTPAAGNGAAANKATGGSAGTSPLAAPTAAPAAGQPDYAAYYQSNPDLQAEYARLQADPATAAQFPTPESYAAYHAQNFHDRPVPTVAADPNAPQPTYYQETYAQRPDAMPVPQFGDAPTFSWDPSQIANDPGFKFETQQTTNNVNAGSAARGLLRSGDAAKALQDRLFGVAHTYGNDYFNRALQQYDRNYANFIDNRSYGTNLWNQQQNRADNIFSEDRGFAANRNDQATSNLFGIAGIGQNAAAGTAAAGNVFANNTIANNNQRAATTANAAIANANNVTNLFGSAAGAVGTYYGLRGKL